MSSRRSNSRGPAAGGTARSAPTRTGSATGDWKLGRGPASFRSSDPGVAPSGGACRYPSRVGPGGRRGGARLHDAYPR